ncbi:hypothetical protein EYF80_058149 [Liparis tanakae]|uniref:Uncharacterized protein n=1 Tax=Liparis tanakae TaxID=230148 RepID=A0A4Z2ETU1_9TELE|nr:hypothetical protein EYF80_058149 [Liparis tanakae]
MTCCWRDEQHQIGPNKGPAETKLWTTLPRGPPAEGGGGASPVHTCREFSLKTEEETRRETNGILLTPDLDSTGPD